MEHKKRCIVGKGNDGMYVDRFPRIYAAGARTLQPNLRVSDCLNNFTVQNVNNDSKTDYMQFEKSYHNRFTGRKDVRNAGPFTESSQLINPPQPLTKFQTLVEDLKCTVYRSYWNKQVGKGADFDSNLPSNIDITTTTFGKKTANNGNLYDIIMPKTCSMTHEELLSKSPGYQSTQNYCRHSFNSDMIHGIKSNADKSGKLVKCCMTDNRVITGTSLKQPILLAQRNFQKSYRAELGTYLTPNNSADLVPEGHVFGKVEDKDNNNVMTCLSHCQLNPERELFYKCLAHLNTLRKCLSKRLNGTFFRDLYLHFKHLDNSKTGWLPKELIYPLCTTKFIRFTPSLIEPLLIMWKAINGTDIEYNTFINIINFREPLPGLPKVCDIPSECIDFSTTYKEMVMTQQHSNNSMAGIPSGRYFDTFYPVTPEGCCKADRSYLTQESDARACLNPSIFTLLDLSHRDMYAGRDPETVKRVFKAAGEDMNRDMFDIIWHNAMKYHPKGLVCYETFRRALMEYKNERL